jgi:hypothetical protein
MEITKDEEETITNLRGTYPCIAMNKEAADFIEAATGSCLCPGCIFLRATVARVATEERKLGITH